MKSVMFSAVSGSRQEGGNPSGITVRKPLSGAPGALTISSYFTVTSWVTIQFWVEYADGSTDYVFNNGTTPAGTYSASFTTSATKTAVALYFYAAASGAFPPYQMNVDYISVVPASSPPPLLAYAFTGEWWEQDVRLLHLRARWYDPGNAVFLSKDPWPGDGQRPQSLNGWSYVEGNPVNRTDPSGLYWWGPGQALWDASELREQSQNIHVRIQALMMMGRMDEIHAEYVIPGTNFPVDLLDSITGEMWEIKPWDNQAQAVVDLEIRLTAIETARRVELLQGMNPVAMRYNWNLDPAIWSAGRSFPTTDVYLGSDLTGWIDFYATQTQPGVIAWWKYQRNRRRIEVPYPILLPERVTFGSRNRRPGWQPAYATTSSIDPVGVCTTILVIGGTVIILADPVPGDEMLLPLLWGSSLAR